MFLNFGEDMHRFPLNDLGLNLPIGSFQAQVEEAVLLQGSPFVVTFIFLGFSDQLRLGLNS